MPNKLRPHHTVTFWLCKGDWCSRHGFSSAQYLTFCLLTYLFRWKWATSDVIKFGRNCGSVSIISTSLVQKFLCIFKSRGSSSCTTWILNGWKCKSMCNILLTLLSDMSSATECHLAELHGLCCGATHTLSTSSGLRTYRGQPAFFFSKAEAIDLNWLTQFKMVRCVRTLPFLPMLVLPKFTLCLSSWIVTFKKALHSKCMMLTRPTLHGN
jgi:hypothetical protein